jgi:hypothetical protein
MRTIVAFAFALAIAAAPGRAEKPDYAGQGGPGKGASPSGPGGPVPGLEGDRQRMPEFVPQRERFTIRERDLFRSWFVQEYGRGKCPPGLAKKGTACLPPGLAKKRYAIGQPLPAGIVIAPVPLDLTRRLEAPPVGYRYGIVDGDLVKLALGTLLVVDAIDGMVPSGS